MTDWRPIPLAPRNPRLGDDTPRAEFRPPVEDRFVSLATITVSLRGVARGLDLEFRTNGDSWVMCIEGRRIWGILRSIATNWRESQLDAACADIVRLALEARSALALDAREAT